MNTLGLLGGMSWESTIPYYRVINETVRQKRGGLHAPCILLHSFEFHRIEAMQSSGDWDTLGALLAEVAHGLVGIGAAGIVLCTNTMHRVVPAIERRIAVPILHIADATGHHVRARGIRTVGLLGTRYTMEQNFYRGRLEARHDLKVLVPDQGDREVVHRVIYEELCQGQIRRESRAEFLRIISDLAGQGAEGVILGCTEIGLLVPPEECPIPAFDTTALHAEAAALWAMGEFAFEN